MIIPPNQPLPEPKKWVEAYADYLFAYTITRIQDEELARDLVQETFLAGLQSLDKFAGKSSERTWLTAILKNKIIDVYRKRSSGLKTEEISQTGHAENDFFDQYDGHWKLEHRPKHFGIDEYDPFTSKEFNHVLKQCMKKLPVLWISVFTMKHMDDELTDTICTELKISAANFWVIIHRAKLNLRACLQKNWI